MVRLPGTVPTGRRATSAVPLQSLPSTVLDLIGLSAEPSFAGPSWMESLDPPPSDSEHPTFIVSSGTNSPGRHVLSMVSDGIHSIIRPDGSLEVYDLRVDPSEANNLAPLADTDRSQER
jgi:hypothetical protein